MSKKKKAIKAAKKAAKAKAPIKKKKKVRAVDTWKSKRWYTIKAPKIFEEKEIGKAVSSDPKLLTGRSIKVTMRDITGNIPQQNIKLNFKVTDVKGESLETMPVAYEYNRGYISRQTRRMHSIITTIADVATKDGYRLRVKALSFGHGKMKLIQRKEIRRITEEMLKATAAKTTYDRLFLDMLHGKVGSEIYKSAKKIYPITRSEIVKSRILAAPQKK
ncbi:MAG: 30S ribosomal protein S3ae [Candidatus Diapherotrites archaeon]|nr:30S ribosomal protein S3ae [Candidatus Diapherotrites archaeon]